MRENLTLIFCVLAGITVIAGPASRPPDLMTAFHDYQAALSHGDARRAARYGEEALTAAAKSPLLDRAGLARLQLMVGKTQAQADNPGRARALYAQAVAGLGDGAHGAELAQAQRRLAALEQLIAGRSALRGTQAANAGSGG